MTERRGEDRTSPPVILLGGTANALSVARSLAPRGIPIYALNDASSHIRHSRHSTWIPLEEGSDPQGSWLRWLTGCGAERFAGAVLVPCSDDALEVVAKNRASLAPHYLLPEAETDRLLAVLDKSSAYAIAAQASVPTPRTISFRSAAELAAVKDEFLYPAALKPRHSHLFQRHFPNTKLFKVRDAGELMQVFERIEPLGLEMMLTEMIPGDDARYCSYYSYLDENYQPLFHFTKRKLRQYPPGVGLGSYHITDWNPEVAELGLRFLQAARLRGIGNPEFKRDPRDGRLKLIECNCRFTGCNEILNLSGIDLPLLVYNRLTGRPLPPVASYKSGVRVIIPISDFLAFRNLRRRGELSFFGWIRSLLHRQHLLYFKLSDPMPALVSLWQLLRAQIAKRLRPAPARSGSSS